MKSKPKARTDADARKAFEKLPPKEQQAMKNSAEAEHTTGPRREALIHKAGPLAEKRPPR